MKHRTEPALARSLGVWGLLPVSLVLLGAGVAQTACVGASLPVKAVIKLGLSPAAPAAPAQPGVNVPAIKVDTVGYPTSWQKVAIFNFKPSRVELVDARTGESRPIQPGTVKELGLDLGSKDYVWRVDFTGERQPGRYYLAADGEKSDPFDIGPDVYRKVLRLAVKALYFQRSRTMLERPHAVFEGEDFLRLGVPHNHEDVGWDMEDYPSKTPAKKWKPEAGWHDAGNYDMYVPSTAPTVQALLQAYERNPGVFADKELDIPESGNGIPDILDEARWGLLWVLSMQEPGGGFRLRETVMTQDEVGNTPPDRDKTVRWIDRVGSASTGKGCALAAVAARVYAKHDKSLAKRAEDSARRGWHWLKEHPDRVLVPATGAAKKNAYLLWDDGTAKDMSDFGARYIAAVEMWRTFREPEALAWVKAHLNEAATPYDYPYGGWGNLSRWGMMTLVDDAPTPEDIRLKARFSLMNGGDAVSGNAETDGYLSANKAPDDYYWASNSNLLEKAQLLHYQGRLDRSADTATQAARDQWHWILGRNPNGFSMVTRVGKSPTALYHAEWGARSPRMPPGFLLGGPNYQDMAFLSPEAPAKAILWDNPKPLKTGTPAHAMFHWRTEELLEGGFITPKETDKGWWAVTEPDVYYQANLILVGALMVAEQQ